MTIHRRWLSHAVVCAALLLSSRHAAIAAPVVPSADVQRLLMQVRQSADHGGAPFLVLDKKRARVWVFDAAARPIGSTPVLLGLAIGDDTVAGIGERPLSEIAVGERTTPAGRFIIEPGRNLRGDDILWIDYDAAVSMHRVHSVNAGERRLERLASPTSADNRISFGCINVPEPFYNRVLSPLFSRARGIAYVLPETRPINSVFDFATKVARRP